jgi:hypothetical protein
MLLFDVYDIYDDAIASARGRRPGLDVEQMVASVQGQVVRQMVAQAMVRLVVTMIAQVVAMADVGAACRSWSTSDKELYDAHGVNAGAPARHAPSMLSEAP